MDATLKALAGALIATACAAPSFPGDAFVGEYDGSYACMGEVDSTGEPYVETFDDTVVIDQHDDGRIFVAGMRCDMPLEALSDRQARVLEHECVTALPDGTPVTMYVMGGAVHRTGSFLTLTFQADVVSPTIVINNLGCSFDGRRAF